MLEVQNRVSGFSVRHPDWESGFGYRGSGIADFCDDVALQRTELFPLPSAVLQHFFPKGIR